MTIQSDTHCGKKWERILGANIRWIMEKARQFQKNIYFCFIDDAKAFDCVDHNKLWKILRDRNTRPPDLPLEKSAKLPKNPRIEDSDGATSQSSLLDSLRHPEESEGGSGLTPSAEQSGEEPGQAASR